MLREEKTGVPQQEEEKISRIQIPKVEINNQVAFYLINVIGAFNSWCVVKRYSQFEELNNTIMSQFHERAIPKDMALPPKRMKLFTSHVSRQFLEERRVLLENYLMKLMNAEQLCHCEAVMTFLSTDKRTGGLVRDEREDFEPPEDVEVTDVSIPATRTMSDHVLYKIDLVNSRKRRSFSKWTVLKRFAAFYEMDAAIRADFAEDPEFIESLPHPPERKFKFVNDHLDPTFIEERRVLLEHYLKEMIRVEAVLRNATFLTFLGVNLEA